MYKLLFRETGKEEWNDGPEFSDDALTQEAKDILEERYRRCGLETRFEKTQCGDVK